MLYVSKISLSIRQSVSQYMLHSKQRTMRCVATERSAAEVSACMFRYQRLQTIVYTFVKIVSTNNKIGTYGATVKYDGIYNILLCITKTWLLKFVDASGLYTHRPPCLTVNVGQNFWYNWAQVLKYKRPFKVFVQFWNRKRLYKESMIKF